MLYSELNDVYNLYLEHYGVLGMKWGVRKDRTPSSGMSPKEKAKQRKKNIKKNVKKRYSMTDEELKKEINRLRDEKEVVQLSKEVLGKGKTKTDSMLKTIGKTTAKGIGMAAASYGVVKIAKSKMMRDEIEYLLGGSNAKEYSEFINQYLIPAIKPKRK